MGVTGMEMPARALGYLASAVATQERYFPEARLQVVFPLRAAHHINGVDEGIGRKHVEEFDHLGRFCFPRRYNGDGQGKDIKAFYDRELPSDELQEAVAGVLATEPKLADQFQLRPNQRKQSCSVCCSHMYSCTILTRLWSRFYTMTRLLIEKPNVL